MTMGRFFENVWLPKEITFRAGATFASGSYTFRYGREFYDYHKGEVSAQVTVAEKLSDANLDALKGALKSVTGGKDIDLDIKIEPAIIGGLIAKVGSRMIDSSIRTKLNAIKFAMKEAR